MGEWKAVFRFALIGPSLTTVVGSLASVGRGSRVVRRLFLCSAFLLASSCYPGNEQQPESQKDVMESGVFDDFRYPERYAAIVEAAEAGDAGSIRILVRYYSNFPKTDLRNLEYWSMRASQIGGPQELTNLIVALASHDECERAWHFVEESYKEPSEFAFYKAERGVEVIDGTCGRSLSAR